MQVVPLKIIPNQSFSIVLDNNVWNFALKATNGQTSVTILRDNVVVVEGARAVANELIIPAKYQEAGNFLFLTQNFQLPEYTQFGVTQLLVYVSQAELDAARIPPVGIITVSDFNPIAALPLRFAPTGYEAA